MTQSARVHLRNAHLAVVKREKVIDYLLNAGHPDNGGKAQFFESLGFSMTNPMRLAEALLEVARSGQVVAELTSIHGQKSLWMDACRRTLRPVANRWSERSG